ncbi:MAG: AraC family transcriptional regulator [Clostridia bacterium]|nr:AraC family transcriptional regulator [Clostridia bacterium]
MFTYKFADYLNSEDGIGITKSIEGKETKAHQHDFIEIVYVVSGKCIQYIDDNKYNVGRGDVLFINYGSSHAFHECEDFYYYNIFFSPKVLANEIITQENALSVLSLTVFDEMRMDKNGGRITFTGKDRTEVEFILDAMFEEFSNPKVYKNKVLGNYLSILLTKMLRKTAVFDDGLLPKTTWDDLKIYIDDNLGERLTLSSLSEKVFYNPSYFSRVFRQKFGCSLTEYITKKRIDLAKDLLTSTDFSVEEIINKSGFSDRGVFYHAFTKYTGFTPNEYRTTKK